MPKHSRDDTSSSRPPALFGALALLLVVVLGAAAFFFMRGDDGDPVADTPPTADPAPATTEAPATDDDAVTTAAEPEDCSPVAVWAAPELYDVVTAAVERASTDCFTFEVTERDEGEALPILRDGDTPDVWVPDSTSWPYLAAEDGVDLQVGEPLASSPVVLLTAPETLETLQQVGITEDSTFADLAATYRELAVAGPAPFSLRVGDPRVDPASMALLTGTRDEPGGWAGDSADSREILVRLAQATVQGDPLTAVRSDPRAVVPATERRVVEAEADAEGFAVAGLALAGDTPVVHVPFVRMDAGGSADAAEALEAELRTEEAAADFTAAGLRPGTDGPAPEAAAVPGGVDTAADAASAEEVVATAQTWAAVAPESRILAIVDISGSMDAQIDGTTRIDLAREALQTAITAIPEQTALGLWYFSTALDGMIDHAEQVPLRPLGAELDDGRTQREALLEVTDDLGLQTLTGDTGLHDTLWAGYQEMQAQQGPDSIATVLLLTDGVDDDTTGGLSEDEVVFLLDQARRSSEIPVGVVLLGMGTEVDEVALQRLADAAGGEFVLIGDPRELPQVFVDVVADRAP